MSLAIAFCAASSSLAMMIGLSTEELTRAAEAVVIGDVEGAESYWSSDGRTIITHAHVMVTEVVKGTVLERRVSVETEGGEVGDRGLRVSDVSSPKAGERVLLFLKRERSKADAHVYVHGLIGKGQGKYVVDDKGLARKRGFSVAGRGELIDNDLPLQDLVDKVRSVRK